jgi:Lrp/AsnC family leucine-responsive transcriptional regulator
VPNDVQPHLDSVDRTLITVLQENAGTSYAALGEAVGLSAPSAHARVRRLRDLGVLTGSTVRVDRGRAGLATSAFVTLSATSWMGGEGTAEAIRSVPEVSEAYITSGRESVLVRVDVADNSRLQDVLRRLHEIPGVTASTSSLVLDVIVERPPALPT